jgi:RHS repeat-associated protein
VFKRKPIGDGFGPQSKQLAGAMPVGLIRNGKLYAIHSDHLGTPRLVTDPDGTPIWQWPQWQSCAFGDNAPTGVLKVTTNAASAITNQPQQLRATTPQEFNLRFPGQYFDAETKLAYNYFRNYQPNTGRYTQSDPIGLEGLNRFGYAGGDALGHVDPRGLQALPLPLPPPPPGPSWNR